MSTYHDHKYCENMTSMVALGTVIFWTDLVDRPGNRKSAAAFYYDSI